MPQHKRRGGRCKLCMPDGYHKRLIIETLDGVTFSLDVQHRPNIIVFTDKHDGVMTTMLSSLMTAVKQFLLKHNIHSGAVHLNFGMWSSRTSHAQLHIQLDANDYYCRWRSLLKPNWWALYKTYCVTEGAESRRWQHAEEVEYNVTSEWVDVKA